MNTIRLWIWKFLGYGCCRPVHHHEIDQILKTFQANLNANLNAQLSDQRAQLFEFFRQQEEVEKVIKVRIVQ